MNFILCVLVSVVASVALVSGEKCYNEAKSKVLQDWLKGKMEKLCSGGYKPGTTSAQLKYVEGVIAKVTSKSFLGCDKAIPGLSEIVKSAKECHGQLTKKDYCQKDVQKNFKDCLVGRVMFQAPGIMGWWEECCSKVSDYLIVPTAKTKAKVTPIYAKFPKP